jgi:hypothetical protein
MLDLGIARTQQRQPPADADQVVDHLKQHVHALLPGQPADTMNSGPSPGSSPNSASSARLLAARLRQLLRVKRAARCGIDLAGSTRGVDPVDDAVKRFDPGSGPALPAPCRIRGADLARIGRADGGDRIWPPASPLSGSRPRHDFHPVHRPGVGGRPSAGNLAGHSSPETPCCGWS